MLKRISDTALEFVGQTGNIGLHARSASYIIRWVSGLDARLTFRCVAGRSKGAYAEFGCNPPSATNFLRLVAMGSWPGDVLEITASGPDAERAIYGVERGLAEEPPLMRHGEEIGPSWRHREWHRRRRIGMPGGDAHEALQEQIGLAIKLIRLRAAGEGLNPRVALGNLHTRASLVARMLSELEEEQAKRQASAKFQRLWRLP